MPGVVSLGLFVVQIALFGQGLFQKGGLAFGSSLAANVVLALSMGLQIGLGLWSFLLVLVGMDEIQRFSIGRAFVNLVLPVLLIIVIFVGVAMMILVFRRF